MQPSSRTTFEQVDRSLPLDEQKVLVADSGRRRHLSWGMDFDTRSLSLAQEISDDWDDNVKAAHLSNRENARKELLAEFGEFAADAKIENFIAIGTKPFSVMAYHNALFDQVRRAFVIGAYYPALVGACTLGERILNHLIIDMRPFFTGTPEYKRVYRQKSFDDWRVPINTLEIWNILLPAAAKEFRALMPLRNRSIHFNLGTYLALREDALAAILHMRTIIEEQFATHALRPWFIPGTLGQVFIRKEYEQHPFVREYFLPRCPFVGPFFGMSYEGGHGWRFHDHPDYGDGAWTDEEFAEIYNKRDPAWVARPENT